MDFRCLGLCRYPVFVNTTLCCRYLGIQLAHSRPWCRLKWPAAHIKSKTRLIKLFIESWSRTESCYDSDWLFGGCKPPQAFVIWSASGLIIEYQYANGATHRQPVLQNKCSNYTDCDSGPYHLLSPDIAYEDFMHPNPAVSLHLYDPVRWLKFSHPLPSTYHPLGTPTHPVCLGQRHNMNRCSVRTWKKCPNHFNQFRYNSSSEDQNPGARP